MTDKSTQKPQAATTPAFDAVRDAQSAGLESLSQVGTVWAEALSDLGAEVLGFVAERVKEDVQTQHKLLHAKSLTEVQQIQSEFVQKALDQYSAETGKLVELGQSAMASIPGGKIVSN